MSADPPQNTPKGAASLPFWDGKPVGFCPDVEGEEEEEAEDAEKEKEEKAEEEEEEEEGR